MWLLIIVIEILVLPVKFYFITMLEANIFLISHTIGAVIGTTLGVSLAIGNFFDVPTRCTMALIIPRYNIYVITLIYILSE